MRPQRFDTLFLRLFVLMWVVLVASHLLAFAISIPLTTGGNSPLLEAGWRHIPPLTSLPPGNPLSLDNSDKAAPPNAPPHERRGRSLPRSTLWADYALRALLMGLGAWLGARWLSAPMRSLARASGQLAQGFEQGRTPPELDETQGTVEVRDTARVFNHMTRQLQQQFDQRSLHMAAISHDLRTPLTRLRLRMEQWPGAAAAGASGDIREMDELINASLAVMREQSGHTQASVIDLCALLQSQVDDLQEQGQPVTLDESVCSPGSRLTVRARPASLRRVTGNLISNAVRYGQRAALSLQRTDQGVEIHVDDAGPGIPPELMEQVFQPWVRLPGAASPTGSGLGLAIARDLIEREGGTLTLSNRSGGGLRATLRLIEA